MGIYRLHLSTTKYTFFSSSHGIFTKIYHILGLKTHCEKLKESKLCNLCYQTVIEYYIEYIIEYLKILKSKEAEF